MAWIAWIDEADAEGKVAEIYFNRIASGLGVELEAPFR